MKLQLLLARETPPERWEWTGSNQWLYLLGRAWSDGDYKAYRCLTDRDFAERNVTYHRDFVRRALSKTTRRRKSA